MGIQHMNNWRSILCVLVLAACTSVGQFSHKKPWPTYSLQNMPQTRFTCHDKILGGYYADPETQCQMFHVCVKVAGVGVQDFRFLCPNGTAFDQEAQICADWGDVDCEQAVLYYGSDNFDLYRIGSGFESKRAPLAEEEEATFHLQRAETGDIRKSKETRVDQKVRPETFSYTKKYESTTRNQFYEGNFDNKKSNYDQNNDFSKVTQRFEAPKKTTSSYYTTPRNNDFHNHADSRQDTEDLFKGSHSSNFFSNRKGGREDDFYDSKPSTTSTTTTPKPYLPQSQFFNGNGPQSDFSDFNKIPDATTKRPHRGRRPISSLNNPNNLISTPTSRASTSSTTYPTTVQDFPKSTKRVTLQASYTPSFNYGNDPFYKSSSSSSTSSTTSTTTQRSSSPAQKFSFSANDYQQNIQPTTYSPSSAFRYKTTTSKYEDINETALRGEKPGQSTLFNSQYENQNFEVFNRVSNRKSSNTERNIQKQQTKNATLANRNEFTDFTKNKIPSGFQVPSNTQQLPGPQSPLIPRLNVQPLDPNKLNSELRNINHTQQPHRGRVPIGRPNDRQQTEPQYFRTRPQETPAPFAVPHAQQNLAEKQFDSDFSGTPPRDFIRIKTDPRISQTPPPQQEEPKPFDAKFSAFTAIQRDDAKTRSELRTGAGSTTDYFPQKQSKPLDINFNISQKESSRIRPEHRIGGASNTDSQLPTQQQNAAKPLDSNLSKYSSIQRENSRIRTEQRLGIASNSGLSSNQAFNPQKELPSKQLVTDFDIPQRENSKTRTEQRLGIASPNQEFKRQKQQPPKQLETNFNTPQRENSKTRTEQRLELAPNQDFNSQKQQPTKQFDGNFNSFRTRTEQRTSVGNPAFQSQKEIFPQQQLKQAHNNFDSNFNAQNFPQRGISRTKAESRTGTTPNADVQTRESFQQRDSFQQGEYNRVRPELTSTTGANTYSATPPRGRGRINYKASTRHQGRSLENDVQSTTSGVKKFSTLVPKDQYYPTTFKPTTYKKASDQKPTKNTEPKSRGTPFSTTPIPSSTLSQSSSTPDEDDGQYHPELYENDYSQNNAAAIKQPNVQAPSYSDAQTARTPQAHLQTQQQTSLQKQNQQPQQNLQQKQKQPLATPIDLSDEEELFKTAHSLNLGAASINKLRADTLKTADKTQQTSPNFGFEKSTFATSISTSSLASTPSTTWRPTTSFSATTTTSTTVRPPASSKKPKKSSASKRPPHADADTSYDYAYYDSLSETPQEYSEYDVISEFRKTKTH